MFLTFIEGSMEVELMVTKRDDDDDRQKGEYRTICLWKMDWQIFAKMAKLMNLATKESRDNKKKSSSRHESRRESSEGTIWRSLSSKIWRGLSSKKLLLRSLRHAKPIGYFFLRFPRPLLRSLFPQNF